MTNMHAERTPTGYVEKDGKMTGAIKMSVALAAVVAIAAPVRSQDPDSDLEVKAQRTMESAWETGGAVAEAIDKNEQERSIGRYP